MIRVEIGIMPALLRSIVGSALEMQEDFVVTSNSENLVGQDGKAADVLVVCSDREPFDRIPVDALTGPNAAAIVAINSEGDSATILQVTTETSRIGAASDLCNAVRRAARLRPAVTN